MEKDEQELPEPDEQPTGSKDQAEEDEQDKKPSPAAGRAIGGGSARGSG